MFGLEQIAAALQGAAFFVSIAILGFAYGHEKVIHDLVVREPGYDRSKPSWQQRDCYSTAKVKAKDYFPLYWYWGNIRAAFLFGVVAFVTEVGGWQGMCRAGELAAVIIILANGLMFYRSGQPRWDSEQD